MYLFQQLRHMLSLLNSSLRSIPISQHASSNDFTHWACRFFAVDAVYATYGVILATLQVIADGDDGRKATQAIGILL